MAFARVWRCLGATALACLLASLAPNQARADDLDPPAKADDDDPLAFHYARFRFASEGAVTLAGGATTLAFLMVRSKAETAWHGGIGFDEDVRVALRAETVAGRRRAQLLSTIPYYGGLAFPYLVDAVAVTWLGRGHGDTAAQMALIDTEAFAIAGALSFVSNAAFRRERPYMRDCRAGRDTVVPSCSDGGGKVESFYSGHTSISFAGAALTCAHHRALPLYGGAGDALACGFMLAAATAGGVGRVIADKHYASDVLVGSAVGLSVGYLTPQLLHYNMPTNLTAGFLLVPNVAPTFVGVSASRVL